MGDDHDGHRVTVDPIIERDGEIALIERKYDPYEGELALPGGHVDPGESPREAVVREAYEETGLDVEVEALCGEYSDAIEDPRGPVIELAYVCSTEDEELEAATDAADAGWYDIEDVLDEEDLAFGHENVLAEYLEG
jgi:8-oxo-dGTP diphosphatase